MGLSLGGLPKTAGENADIDSEVGMLMTEFDSNQDGSVSREEFRSSLERCADAVWDEHVHPGTSPHLLPCDDAAQLPTDQTAGRLALPS
jgi:hypothetical protein